MACCVGDEHGGDSIDLASCLMQTSLHTSSAASLQGSVPLWLAQQAAVAAAATPETPADLGAWPEEPMPVWIYTFGRSGSTLLEKLVLSMVPDPADRFCVFEPCHGGDRASFASCAEEMESIMRCDYRKVERLYWWGYQEEGMKCGAGQYSPGAAQTQCSRARFRVFKTIHMHNMAFEALPLLRSVPNLKVINLVRDPRDVYRSAVGMGMVTAAVKSLSTDYDGLGPLSPSWRLYGGGDPGPLYIMYVCEMMQEQAQVASPGLLHLRYEDFAADSGNATRRVHEFLGTPNSREQHLATSEVLGGESSGPTGEDITASFAWTCAERAAFESEVCAAALRSWRYDPVHPWRSAADVECGGGGDGASWASSWHDLAIKVRRSLALLRRAL